MFCSPFQSLLNSLTAPQVHISTMNVLSSSRKPQRQNTIEPELVETTSLGLPCLAHHGLCWRRGETTILNMTPNWWNISLTLTTGWGSTYGSGWSESSELWPCVAGPWRSVWVCMTVEEWAFNNWISSSHSLTGILSETRSWFPCQGQEATSDLFDPIDSVAGWSTSTGSQLGFEQQSKRFQWTALDGHRRETRHESSLRFILARCFLEEIQHQAFHGRRVVRIGGSWATPSPVCVPVAQLSVDWAGNGWRYWLDGASRRWSGASLIASFG